MSVTQMSRSCLHPPCCPCRSLSLMSVTDAVSLPSASFCMSKPDAIICQLRGRGELLPSLIPSRVRWNRGRATSQLRRHRGAEHTWNPLRGARRPASARVGRGSRATGPGEPSGRLARGLAGVQPGGDVCCPTGQLPPRVGHAWFRSGLHTARSTASPCRRRSCLSPHVPPHEGERPPTWLTGTCRSGLLPADYQITKLVAKESPLCPCFVQTWAHGRGDLAQQPADGSF